MKKKGVFVWAMMAPMAASLIAPIAYSLKQLRNSITRKVVMRAQKGQEGGFFFHY